MTLATRTTNCFMFTTSLVIRIVLRASIQTYKRRSQVQYPRLHSTKRTLKCWVQSPRVGTMRTLTSEGGSKEEVEALDAAMRELAAEQDWSHVAERALALALDLTDASVSFIRVDDQADGGRRFYSTTAHPSAMASAAEMGPLRNVRR